MSNKLTFGLMAAGMTALSLINYKEDIEKTQNLCEKTSSVHDIAKKTAICECITDKFMNQGGLGSSLPIIRTFVTDRSDEGKAKRYQIASAQCEFSPK